MVGRIEVGMEVGRMGVGGMGGRQKTRRREDEESNKTRTRARTRTRTRTRTEGGTGKETGQRSERMGAAAR